MTIKKCNDLYMLTINGITAYTQSFDQAWTLGFTIARGSQLTVTA